ncbi:MAG TPA: mechanosensitive ion channel domain-containing protein [Syntrophobacteria bacterium]|nr:mechanosensitive ion channel domain-containing protein [Syntrophobacteria bacterium]
MGQRSVTTIWLVPILAAGLILLAETVAAQGGPPSQPSPGEKGKAVAPPSLADLIPWATGLSDRLNVLKKSVETLVDLSATGEQLQSLSKEVGDISRRLEKLKASERYGFDQVAEARTALHRQAGALVKVLDPLTAAITQMDAWQKEWSDENNKAKEFRTSLPRGVAAGTVRPVLDQAQKTIDTALSLIAQGLKPILEAQRQAGDIQARISSLTMAVNGLIQDLSGDIREKSDPSMFASQYYDQFGPELWRELREGLGLVSWPGREFVAGQGWPVFLQCVVVVVLALSIRRHRRFLEQSERWRFLAGRPIAAGLLVAVMTITPFQQRPPALWIFLLWVAGGVALGRLAGALITTPWRRRLLYALIPLLIINQLFRVIAVPRPLLRVYMLTLALVGFALFLWQGRKNARRGESPFYTWALRGGALLFLAVVGAEVSGYSALGTRLLEASLKSVFLVLVAWMLVLLGRGGLEWGLYKSPLRNIPLWRRAADVIAGKATFLLSFVLWTFFGALILCLWGAYSNPFEAIRDIMSLGITVGTTRITLGLVLTAGALLYGSLLASWIVQAALAEGLLSRRQLDPGVRISLASLVRYAFILIGFLLALAALGVNLREITILAGALGVGIGFGLQTVVNNFVCGLILLFERPIKVGDYVQLGEQWGKIRHIGLRSTIVQTFENSEIVVPNNDLVANQVTNWTLSDRVSRITIPVRVAHGSDVSLVMETIRACAEENALVMKNPAPDVSFTGFGESALDFRLLAWVADVDNRGQAQTAILRAIDRRFRELKIEIPFPQTDVRIRSAADSASRTLSGPAPSAPDSTPRKEPE